MLHGAKLAIQIITWALIVLGWVTVHYLTLTRERQKEIRELKSKLIERILDVESRSISFHQASNYNQDEARSLVAEIERVSSAIARKPLSILAIEPKVVTQFRRSITLKNFDQSIFTSQAANSRLLNDISLRTEALTNVLEEAYANRYLNGWRQAFRV